MLELLLEYLKINTAQPNPDYALAIALFKNQAHIDGFLTQEIKLPSGNVALVITLQGENLELPAVVLNHHMDVVPVQNTHEWIHPPFAGVIEHNTIYGRGTQDIKAVGVAHYQAIKELKQRNIPLQRTVHVLLVPDEECGGFKGTKELIEHPSFAKLNIGFVVDEGMPSGNGKELLIKTQERTPAQIRITSTAKMGHASDLMHENCIHYLVSFLQDLTDFHSDQQKKAHIGDAGLQFSCHITSLTTQNTALNVIPSSAQATIDFRIPGQHSIKYGLSILQKIIEKYPTITYEVVATSNERFENVNIESKLYETIVKAIKEQGLIAKPFAFQATTDSRFYSSKGIEAIGLTPFTVTPNLHGTNECITIEDMELATQVFISFLVNFCGK